MPTRWVATLEYMPIHGPILWVCDTSTQSITHMTPAAAALLAPHVIVPALRTKSEEFHWLETNAAIKTGRERSQLEWLKYSGTWHKLASTKFPVGGTLVLNSVLDVTHLDPRAEWLARINLQTQRLELANGGSISFPEFMVLHGLVKGQAHKLLADTLNISPKTVEYRISKLKIALEAETTSEMMQQISSSGLIYMAIVPIDARHPAKTETELYKKVIG